MSVSPMRRPSSDAQAIKIVGRPLRGAAANKSGGGGRRRRVVELRCLGGEESGDSLGGRKPPAGKTCALQANALAAGAANSAGDPANQAAQGDGLALAMGRKAPASPRERFTVTGGDLVVDRGHFATPRSPLIGGDLGAGSPCTTSPVVGLRRISSTTS